MFSNAKLNELNGWIEIIDAELPHLEYDFLVYVARFDARKAVQTRIAMNTLETLRAEYSARMNEIVNAELAALETGIAYWAEGVAYGVDFAGGLLCLDNAEYSASVYDALFIECGNGQVARELIEVL